MMMMPMAWAKDKSLTPEARAFFRYHSCMLEPWDGPAAIVFTDGKVIGATLDRNGLRPARFKIFDDGYFMLASEAGLVFDFPGKGRASRPPRPRSHDRHSISRKRRC